MQQAVCVLNSLLRPDSFLFLINAKQKKTAVVKLCCITSYACQRHLNWSLSWQETYGVVLGHKKKASWCPELPRGAVFSSLLVLKYSRMSSCLVAGEDGTLFTALLVSNIWTVVHEHAFLRPHCSDWQKELLLRLWYETDWLIPHLSLLEDWSTNPSQRVGDSSTSHL